MQTIKDTVQQVMRALRVKRTSRPPDDPVFLLPRVLTKQERLHAKAAYFKDGVIGIQVDSSGWLYHLTLKKTDVLQALRSRSAAVIKDIRFYLGEMR